MRSNVSVAPPIDLLCYQADSLKADIRIDIANDESYFIERRTGYGPGSLELFTRMPDPDWLEAASD